MLSLKRLITSIKRLWFIPAFCYIDEFIQECLMVTSFPQFMKLFFHYLHQGLIEKVIRVYITSEEW